MVLPKNTEKCHYSLCDLFHYFALLVSGNRGRRETELKANKCSHYLIDTCAWPQCNFNCPKIRNPFTGEDMDFIDLLMQFGLDLSSIADALGMDMQTLQSMDHNLLMQLLAQQT